MEQGPWVSPSPTAPPQSHLHLHVSRPLDVALQQQAVVVEGRQRLPPRGAARAQSAVYRGGDGVGVQGQ